MSQHLPTSSDKCTYQFDRRKDPGSTRGARVIKPKRAALLKQNNLKKVGPLRLVGL